MSAQETVGQILSQNERRDAIHFAVAPVTAPVGLRAGDRVFSDGNRAEIGEQAVGIVDPFLRQPVRVGERFWLFLFPNTITNLRHEWEHPAFAPEEPRAVSVSEVWMRTWAKEHLTEDYYGGGGLGDEEAYLYALDAGKTHSIGCFESARDYIDAEWWAHWEAITGLKGDRSTYFRCSC